MFFYEVGYSDYEACPIRVICHTKQFTKQEFSEMMVNCYVKASKDSEAKQIDWLSNSPELTDEDRDYYKYKPRVGSLYSDAYGFMITDYGFTEPNITANFIASDTEDIVPDDRSEFLETHCEDLKALRERFNVIEPRDNKINDILNGK